MTKALQVHEDLALQRKAWRTERLGWAVFASILLAAAAGLFGAGPLAGRQASSADGALRVEYPRFARVQSPFPLRLTVRNAAAGPLRVWISREYLRKLDLRRVTPPPERTLLGGDRVLFEFPWEGAPGEADVTFLLGANAPGSVRGRIGAGDQAEVRVAHFLYP